MGRMRPRDTCAPLLLLALTLAVAASDCVARDINSRRNASGPTDEGDEVFEYSLGRGFSFSAGGSSVGPSPDAAIAFVPARVDFGRVETCRRHTKVVSIENRGNARVKLLGAAFSRDEFALSTDVAGIHLDPGGRFLVELRFLPGEPRSYHGAYFRLSTTSGLFTLPLHSEVHLHSAGFRGERFTVPLGSRLVQSLHVTNPTQSLLRIIDVYTLENLLHLSFPDSNLALTPARLPPDPVVRRSPSVWDFFPGASRSLVTFSFESTNTGDFISYIHVVAEDGPFAMVPIRVTVIADMVHVDPAVLDVGVLTTRQRPHRQQVIIYNTLGVPITVEALRTLTDGMTAKPKRNRRDRLEQVPVTISMVNGSFILPPKSRAELEIQVEFPLKAQQSAQYSSNEFSVALELETSATIPLHPPPPVKMRVVGKALNGAVTFQSQETFFGLMVPLKSVFPFDRYRDLSKVDKVNVSRLIPMASMSASDSVSVVEAGIHTSRTLRLGNLFDVPLKMERVFIDGSEDPDAWPPAEVSVLSFNNSFAASPNESWPEITLDVSPTLNAIDMADDGELLLPRSYPLVIVTNATIHTIPIHLFHGIVRVRATRGLSRHALSGYYPDAAKKKGTKTVRDPYSCLSVNTDTPARKSSKKPSAQNQTFRARVCRSLQFNLSKVAIHGKPQQETVLISNWNPVPIDLSLSRVAHPRLFDFRIRAEMIADDEREIPFGLTVLQSKWKANATFELVNDARLTALSDRLAVDDGDEDKFVIPPGFSVALHIELRPKGQRGAFTAHLLSLKTPFEVLHIHSYLDLVDGVVAPILSEVTLPSMFVGQTLTASFLYRNTFTHAVRVTNVSLPRSMVTLLELAETIPAGSQVAKVITVSVSPFDDPDCFERRFVADCWIQPLHDSIEASVPELSEFGEDVTDADLMALALRDDFWKREAIAKSTDATLTYRLYGQVLLETDILKEIAPIELSIPIERPRILVSEDKQLVEVTNQPFQVQFPLTHLYHMSYIFVNITNPANGTIHAELTFTKVDRQFFFECDDANATEDECLSLWRSSRFGATSQYTCASDDLQQCIDTGDFDPRMFYFHRAIVPVAPGATAQLGPIYYFPVFIHSITVQMFVRNHLSHIEPLEVNAHSGKAILNVRALSPIDRGVRVKSAQECLKEDGAHSRDCHGSIEFVIDDDTPDSQSEDNQSANGTSLPFARQIEIRLFNSGEFDLIISNVELDGQNSRDGFSSPPFSLLSFPEPLATSHGWNDARVLVRPGAALDFVVAFNPTCMARAVARNLLIESSDGMSVIHLNGSITTRMAFDCLRQRSQLLGHLSQRLLWNVGVLAGIGFVLLIAFDLIKSVVVGLLSRKSNVKRSIEETELCGVEDSQKPTLGDCLNADEIGQASDVSSKDDNIALVLSEMDQVPYKPTLPIVLPTVRSVLERRQRSALESGPSKSRDTRKSSPLSSSVPRSHANDTSITMAAATTAVEFSQESVVTAQSLVSKPGKTESPKVNKQPTTGKGSVKLSENGGIDLHSSLPKSGDELHDSPSSTATVKSVQSGTGSGHSDSTKAGILHRDDEIPQLVKSGATDETIDSPSALDDPLEALLSVSRLSSADMSADDHVDVPLWDAKTWWQSSTENSSQERTRQMATPSVGHSATAAGILGPRSEDLQDQGGRTLTDLSMAANRGAYISMRRHENHPRGVVGKQSMASVHAPPQHAVSTTKAPPGFTPADASPLKSLEAFHQLHAAPFTSDTMISADSIRRSGVGSNGLEAASSRFDYTPPRQAGDKEPALARPGRSNEPPRQLAFGRGALPLFDSAHSLDALLHDTSTNVTLGEIGSKRLASFRDIWMDSSADGRQSRVTGDDPRNKGSA